MIGYTILPVLIFISQEVMGLYKYVSNVTFIKTWDIPS